MKYTFLLSILFLLSGICQGQYTMQGKIEYERKVSLHRTLDNMDEDDKRWYEKFRSQIPKFKIDYFDLYFNNKRSVYKPGRENDNGNLKMWFASTPASDNVVYTDFANQAVTAYKTVYEEKFLVQDSMRKLEWKMVDELRMIGDYKCKKAVSKICDSVVVVAFYTEDIIASGGPEMFSGLPGMILEVAIPRLFTTWVATKIDINPPGEKDMTAPEKGKKTTQKELHEVVNSSFKRWGKSAQRYVWWTML